ncbi:MAG TPA: hypothetical protein VGL83_21155 [Stellaceae bacterium]|jgi:hypothetical protein
MIGRLFGWVFLLAAGAVLVRDGIAWYATGAMTPQSFNSLWFDLSSHSLGLFRGAVLGTIPWLWRLVLSPILSLWAGPILLLVALYLLWSSREAKRRRFQ